MSDQVTALKHEITRLREKNRQLKASRPSVAIETDAIAIDSSLQKLLDRCKYGVALDVNRHRDFHESVSEYMSGRDADDEIEPEIYQKMIETDTIISLQFHPDTPVGFYQVYHYDLSEALSIALETTKEN